MDFNLNFSYNFTIFKQILNRAFRAPSIVNRTILISLLFFLFLGEPEAVFFNINASIHSIVGADPAAPAQPRTEAELGTAATEEPEKPTLPTLSPEEVNDLSDLIRFIKASQERLNQFRENPGNKVLRKKVDRLSEKFRKYIAYLKLVYPGQEPTFLYALEGQYRRLIGEFDKSVEYFSMVPGAIKAYPGDLLYSYIRTKFCHQAKKAISEIEEDGGMQENVVSIIRRQSALEYTQITRKEKLSPTDQEVLQCLAELLEEAMRLSDEETAGMIHNELGCIYLILKNLSRSSQEYRMALSKFPDDYKYNLNCGILTLKRSLLPELTRDERLKRLKEAESYFLTSIKNQPPPETISRRPSILQAYNFLGYCHLKSGDSEKGLAQAARFEEKLSLLNISSTQKEEQRIIGGAILSGETKLEDIIIYIEP